MYDVDYKCTLDLKNFLQVLDQQYEAKAKKDKGMMAKRQREIGVSSNLQPPINAPAWAVAGNIGM